MCRISVLGRKRPAKLTGLSAADQAHRCARIHVGRDLEPEESRAKEGNQPFEFLVLHCALPQIHELAYDLEVAGFVVPG